MSVHSISSREFTARVAEAKRWTVDGPVYITDRGSPAHVLLSYEEFQRMKGAQRSLVDQLAMDDGDGIEFNPAKAAIRVRDIDMGPGE